MLQQICDIVRSAADLFRGAELRGDQIHEKTSASDLVTQYDVQVEEFLKRELAQRFPKAAFLGEEEGGCDDADEIFVIDPIDGTTNFIRGYHHSNISVGYVKNGEVKYAVVYDPFRDELFSAEQGKGAWCNGKPISVSHRKPEEGLFLVGSSPYDKSLASRQFHLSMRLFERMADFRRLAAAALDFCYVACGRAEIYFEPCLQPWDYMAGILIAKEAGAMVMTMEKTEVPLFKESSVFVSNRECAGARELLEM